MGNKGSAPAQDEREQIIVDVDGGEIEGNVRASSAGVARPSTRSSGSAASSENKRRVRQHLDEFYTGRRSIEQVMPSSLMDADDIEGHKVSAGSRISAARRRSVQHRLSVAGSGGRLGSQDYIPDDGIVAGRRSVDSTLYRLKRKEDREAEIAAIEADLEEQLGKEVLIEEISRWDWVWTGVLVAACIGVMVAIFILGPDVHQSEEYQHLYGVSANETLYYALDDHKPFKHVQFVATAGVEYPANNTQPEGLQLTAQPGYCKNHCESAEDFVALDDETLGTKDESFPLIISFKTNEYDREYGEGEEPVVKVTTNNNAPLGVSIESFQSGTIGRYQVLIAGLILIMLFLLIMTDVIHRTLSAFVGMFVAIFFLVLVDKAPDMVRIWEHIDQEVIILLLGMMIIVHVLSTTGLFEYLAVKSYQWSGGTLTKLWYILVILTAVLSAFLDNVTTVLLIAPVTINLSLAMKVDPLPLLISEAILSNIGGTATLIGDPPNIIIGAALADYVGFVDFLANLLPVVLIIAVFVLGFLRWWYRKELVKETGFVDVEELKHEYRIRKKLLLIRAGIVFGCVVVLFFTEPVHHVQAPWIALLGAVVLMLLSEPHDLQHTLESVEWDLLLFFAALFVCIESLAEMGLIRWIGDLIVGWVRSVPESQQLTVAIVILVWVSGIVSGILDNIPYTTTMVPVIVQMSRDPVLQLPIRPLIWSLALGACLGGNMTLIGASANLVVSGIAGRSGHKITFVSWLKQGPSVTFISLTIAMIYCILRYSVGGDHQE
eukprot:CAMPEP_0185856496 /NCGR_PEP_ID=MMETSP1354-20130828/29027_1 /TAXON_ID=708628 /ORGANISM="Erythrolobus madagascarensis, Strain CCMP3276" /LENGTH=774 /DNA_ID=CAMNT_0028558747 /DNA_START=241 /DNA_END=2565 /DNA_ORIENTATION=-